MAQYRDPKVTTPTDRRGGAGRWIAIAVAAIILAVLIFWWLAGGDEELVVVPTDGTATEGTATVPAEPVKQ